MAAKTYTNPEEYAYKALGKGYSLWLAPAMKSPQSTLLFNVTETLSKEYGTPNFAPHVTLLSPVNESPEKIVESLKMIVQQVQSSGNSSAGLPVHISGELGRQNEYWRSLYLLADGEELRKLNVLAQKTFGTSQTFMPHLSLAYGLLSDKVKGDMASKIEHMLKSNGDLSFHAEKILVMNCSGKPEEWEEVGEVPLV